MVYFSEMKKPVSKPGERPAISIRPSVLTLVNASGRALKKNRYLSSRTQQLLFYLHSQEKKYMVKLNGVNGISLHAQFYNFAKYGNKLVP